MRVILFAALSVFASACGNGPGRASSPVSIPTPECAQCGY